MLVLMQWPTFPIEAVSKRPTIYSLRDDEQRRQILCRKFIRDLYIFSLSDLPAEPYNPEHMTEQHACADVSCDL